MHNTPTHHTCKNCHNNFKGNYCNYCGEKAYNEHDKSIKHVLEEALHFFSHFEGKLFTTVKTIITKPGKYSFDYCHGIRKKYYQPISLFLLLVVLYLLFPKMQGLNMKLDTYVSSEYSYAWYGKPLVIKKLASSGYSYTRLAERYDHESPKVSKILLLLYLPLTALSLWLIFINKRKPFFDHFIIATEFNAFMLGVSMMIFPVIYLIALIFYWLKLAPPPISENILGIILCLMLLSFSYFAFNRFYAEKKWITLLKTISLVAVYLFVIHSLYNIIILATVLLFI
jgi:hypothetical protein